MTCEQGELLPALAGGLLCLQGARGCPELQLGILAPACPGAGVAEGRTELFGSPLPPGWFHLGVFLLCSSGLLVCSSGLLSLCFVWLGFLGFLPLPV